MGKKKKDYLDKLAEAAEELNEVLGLEPKIETDSVTKATLEEKVIEAAGLMSEDDEVSEGTQAILTKLGVLSEADAEEDEDFGDEEEAEEDDEEEDDEEAEDEEAEEEAEEHPDADYLESLRDSVKNAKKRNVLKALAKSEPEFKGINAAKLKTLKNLQAAMLEAIDAAVTTPAPAKKADKPAPAKKADKPAPAKKEKAPAKKKEPKGPSPYSVATEVMCADPTIDFKELTKRVEKAGIDMSGKSAAQSLRTAHSSVRKISKLLQENGWKAPKK